MRAPISAPVNLKIENCYVIIIIPTCMSVRENLITVGKKNCCSLVIDVRGFVIIIIPMSVRENLITVGKNGCSLAPNLRVRERLTK